MVDLGFPVWGGGGGGGGGGEANWWKGGHVCLACSNVENELF